MYYVVFSILYCISLLPFFVLYLLSDFFYFITWYIIGYRKKIVFKNLLIAFPEKTLDERKKIAKEFYHNFWDNGVEALKLLSISKEAMLNRVTGNMTALESIYKSGRSCHILMGHQFNWEWSNAFVMMRDSFPLLAAYSPLTNNIFNRLFLILRRRFGTVLLPYNDMRRGMLPYRHKQFALALMADQSPSNARKSYWVNFFNTPTAFLQGPEKGARLGNMPVVFVALSKPRRGHYHLETSLLTNNAALTTEHELTQKYAQQLEANIRLNPSLYLWSHNRWKHTWNEKYTQMHPTRRLVVRQ
jgi:KDO2-lipid IV(A) lauroyltransferase